MFCSTLLRLAAFLCLLFAIVLPLHAQLGQGGTVSGLVAATDGSRIPQASIILSGPDGFRRVVCATADGTFSIVELPSGTYAAQASAPGFTATTQSAVSVAIGCNTQLTFTLTVIGTSQTVNVSAKQSSFDTTQTSSVVNIDHDRIEELPIPNRNYLTFVALSPQAAPPIQFCHNKLSPNRAAALALEVCVPAVTQSTSTA